MQVTRQENGPAAQSESRIQTLEDVIELLKTSTFGSVIKEIITVIDADDVQVSGVVLSEKKVYERELLPMDHIIISIAGLRSDLPRGIYELD